MRHISWLGDHNGRPFHHSLCTLTKALARLRSGLLFRPALVVRTLGLIPQRWPAVMAGIFSLEPQRIRLRSLGQGRELQLPRTTTSAPAALWALWSDDSGQYHGNSYDRYVNRYLLIFVQISIVDCTNYYFRIFVTVK